MLHQDRIELSFACFRINLIYRLIDRGMLQSITLPQRKVGAGRTAVTRRTPDLRDPAYKEHKFMPK